MSHRFLILLLFFCSFVIKGQQLFYQNTFRGGACGDGISYNSQDYIFADTIHFANTVPTGATIKKVFLISRKSVYFVGNNPIKEPAISFKFNNNTIAFDSTDNATTVFYCTPSPSSGKNWMVAKDVTALALAANNVLIKPDQYAIVNEYVYVGFYLLIVYENASLPLTNVAIFLNNQSHNNTITHTFNGLNRINTTSDAGLAIWTENVSGAYPIQFDLTSSLGTVNLGTLREYIINSTGFLSQKVAGSFDYQNNTLGGLVDDTPNAFIDSTDALANVKTYLANNTQNFNLISQGTAWVDCINAINSFFLAYSTPCPARGFTDTLSTHTICEGQAVTLGTQSTGNAYSWYPANSLNNAAAATPVASPTTTTNYIVSIDSMGCKHTEQVRVYVIPAPRADTIKTTDNVCGGPTGSVIVTSPNGVYDPYTYSLNNAAFVSDTVFNPLPAGSYTVSIKDSNGCSWQSNYPLLIKDTLLAVAYINANPTTGVAPLNTLVTALGTTGVNTYNWYVDGALVSSNTFLNYTFADSGTYTVTLIAYNNIPTCADTATVNIIVLPQDTSGIFIPNVFSPNGDGVNDHFELKMKNVELTGFEIYNRFGVIVFKSEINNQLSAVSWDGRTTSGMPCSEGTYFYVIETKGQQGESKSYKGFLSLVR